MAINHNSFMDSIFLPLMVKRPMTFLAKDEYFITPGFKGFLMRTFFKAWARCRSIAPVATRVKRHCALA